MTGCSNWRGIIFASLLMGGVALPAFALERVTFDLRGMDTKTAASLRAVSGLAPFARGSGRTAQDILGLAKAEYTILLEKLYSMGRYGAVISITVDGVEAGEIAALSVPDSISQIVVSVDAGPEFIFEKAAISPLASNGDLPSSYAVGAQAGSTAIIEATTLAIEGWRARGYAKAGVVSSVITANHNTSKVAADITINQGPRLRFGPLAVSGARNVRTERVRAIAGLPVGEVFSPEDMQRSANRLRRTGAFRSVVLEESAAVGPDNTLGITAIVAEERPRRLAVSGSIASLDGVSFGLSGTHRNLFGGAERVILAAEARRLGIEAGALDYTLSAKFERPATFSPDTTFALGVTFDRAREAQSTNDALNLSASLTHYFSDTLTGTGGVAYGVSRAEDPSGISFFRTLSLPINLAWDTRNFKKTASDGVYMLADIKPSVGFGAAESGTRIAFDARGYKGVTPSDSLVLALRLRFGVILGSSLAGTPREDLFYSGGPSTVRGQPYQGLGVQELRDDAGAAFETGGTHYLGASFEARQRLSETLGLVGFVDLGRIDAGGYFNTADNWHAGAGLGLRYMTAIGPVRLDLAAPVAGKTGDGLQIYIGIGQAF